MIRRTGILLIEIAGALMGAAALAAALVGWRLTQGPVQLDLLAPYVADAINEAGTGVTVGLSSLTLSWSGEERRLVLVADNVVARTDAGAASVLVPRLGLRLSVAALGRGVVAPRSLTFERPQLHLVREADGSFSFGGGDGADGAVVGALLAAMQAPPDTTAAGALREVRISEAHVRFEDRRLDATWTAPRADIVLSRTDAGLRAEGHLELESGARTTSVDLRLDHDIAQGTTAGVLRFAGMVLDDFTDFAGLDGLGTLTSALAGEVRFRLSGTTELQDLAVDLVGTRGEFRLPLYYDEPLPVESLRLRADYDGLDRRLELHEATVDLGAPVLSATGKASLVDGVAAVEARTVVVGMRMGELARYWPPALGSKARAWVTGNIRNGTADRAVANVALRLPVTDPGKPEIDRFDGTIDYTDLSVEWLKGMPVVTGIDGTATFGPDRLDLSVVRGRSLDLAVRGAEIAITGLGGIPGAKDERIALDIDVGGPLKSALDILDRPPFGLIADMGFDARDIQGKAGARVRLDLPIHEGLSPKDVSVATSAELRRVTAEGLIPGADLRDADLRLDVTGAGLSLSGTGMLGGVPVRLAWQESFGRATEHRRRGRLQGTVEAGALATRGVDVGTRVQGPVDIDLLYTVPRQGDPTLAARLGLGAAALSIPELEWAKPVGVPASADLFLVLKDGALGSIPRFDVAAGELAASGSYWPRAGGQGFGELRLDRFRLGATNVAATVAAAPDGGYRADVRGPLLDAAPLLDNLRAAESGGDAEPGPSLELTLALDRVRLGEGRELMSVDGSLSRDALGWAGARIEARLDGNAPLSLQYGPDAGGHRLLLRSTDAGAALRAFGLYRNAVGGNLVVAAVQDRTQRPRLMKGEIELQDYLLVRAPGIARLLNAASLSGLNALLNGQGIPMSRLTARFSWDAAGFQVEDVKTSGGALGLTADGRIDLTRDRIDIRGVVVPIYGVNRVIGAIPLLGTLLTGGDGQGLLAMTYRMSGPLSDPQVMVNPLAALAPGFLRNLFFLGTAPGG